MFRSSERSQGGAAARCSRPPSEGAPITAQLIAAAAISLVSGCGGETADAGSRLRGAAPVEVVSADLDALDAGEAAAMRLLTPAFADRLKGSADDPLDNWVEVDEVEIGTPRRDATVGSARRHPDVLLVPVEFHLEQRRELSMPDGRTTWGFVVVRDGASQPWLIDDQGRGETATRRPRAVQGEGTAHHPRVGVGAP